MSVPRRVARRRSREAALQVLYALDLAERATGGAVPSVDEVFERVAASFDLPEGARAFAKQLACEAVRHRERIDELVAAHALNWRVPRMAVVDRNVLRLAAYELCHTDTPAPVVLDEAVELARRFGAEGSPGFVNGVLDGIARATRPGEPTREDDER